MKGRPFFSVGYILIYLFQLRYFCILTPHSLQMSRPSCYLWYLLMCQDLKGWPGCFPLGLVSLSQVGWCSVATATTLALLELVELGKLFICLVWRCWSCVKCMGSRLEMEWSFVVVLLKSIITGRIKVTPAMLCQTYLTSTSITVLTSPYEHLHKCNEMLLQYSM